MQCRVCLVHTNSMFDIYKNMKIKEKTFFSSVTILDVLQKVVSTKIVCNERLPHHICSGCFHVMKVSYNFIKRFENSQEKLKRTYEDLGFENYSCEEEQVKSSAVDNTIDTVKSNVIEVDGNVLHDLNIAENIKSQPPVEIIFGDSKYNLHELVVIEKKDDDARNIKDILNNLGEEITTSFVGNPKCLSRKRTRKMLSGNRTFKSSNAVPKDNSAVNIHRKKSCNKESEMHDVIKLEVIKSCDSEVNSDSSDVEIINIITEDFVSEESERDEIQGEVECTDTENDNKTFEEDTFRHKIFETNSKYSQHKRNIHEHEDQFTCEMCGYVVKTKAGLHRHKITTHFERKYNCNVCNRKYSTSSRLKTHMEGHSDKKKYLCSICGKGYNYSNAFLYHLKLHSGEKSYICSYCGKDFTMPDNLNRHLRIHTGEKPYECGFCHKRFASKSQLTVHEYGHTGHRPYKCKYCNRGFITSQNYKLHLFSHRGPYKCKICEKGFIEVEVLSRHYKVVHKKNVEISQDVEKNNGDE